MGPVKYNSATSVQLIWQIIMAQTVIVTSQKFKSVLYCFTFELLGTCSWYQCVIVEKWFGVNALVKW